MVDLTARIEQLLRSGLAGGGVDEKGCSASGAPPELRPDDPGFADAVTRLLGMPLDQYARTGAPLTPPFPRAGASPREWSPPAPARAAC